MEQRSVGHAQRTLGSTGPLLGQKLTGAASSGNEAFPLDHQRSS